MSEVYLKLLLAAIAAPGFWKLLEAALTFIVDVFTGRKRVTNEQIVESVNSLKTEVTEVKTKVNNLEGSLEKTKYEEEEKDVVASRRRILRFNDELLRDIDHSKEYFDDILEDVHTYEQYCEDHKDFKNEKAVMAIKNIRRCYDTCMKKHSFL